MFEDFLSEMKLRELAVLVFTIILTVRPPIVPHVNFKLTPERRRR